MNIKFELTENVQALVIEDVSTVKPVVTLTTYDDYVFLEEVACGGELLIITVTNKGERLRRYAVKTTEMLKHAKVLTSDKNKIRGDIMGKRWSNEEIKYLEDNW